MLVGKFNLRAFDRGVGLAQRGAGSVQSFGQVGIDEISGFFRTVSKD
jgi:hypothetical protein